MKRNSSKKNRTNWIIIILIILIALLIPVCILFARDMIDPIDGVSSVSESSSSAEESGQEDASDVSQSSSDEESTPEPVVPLSGPVPESAVVQPSSYLDGCVFFGDSLTAGLGLYSELDAQFIAGTGVNPQSVFDRPVINIPGSDERITMMAALENVDPSPARIYIGIGANWVGESSGISEDTFCKHYVAMLNAIQEMHPDSDIFLQSMLPVSKEYDTNETGTNRYGLTNSMIRTFNALIEQIAVDEGVWYLDVNSSFVNDEGYLPSDETTDGMHLKPEFYSVWVDYLLAHPAPGDESKTTSSDPSDSSNSSDSYLSENEIPISAAVPSSAQDQESDTDSES